MFELIPPRNARRVAVGLLAAASLALGITPAAAAAPPEQPPLDIAVGAEERFVAGATALTNLTAARARDIFRNHPKLALDIPVSYTDEVQLFGLSDTPAGLSANVNPSLYPIRACWVKTTRKVHGWAGTVMYSFSMAQRWRYNGRGRDISQPWRVWPDAPTISWNVTGNGFPWAFNGIVYANGHYHKSWNDWWARPTGSPYGMHHSIRVGQFVYGGPYPIYHNIKRWIEKFHNGGWKAPRFYHTPGC